jgi:tRNA-dihydrouridine synthase A
MQNNQIDKHKVSVAPMMDWTDRHCRHFHRLIAPSVQLYTEMVTTGALIFGKDEERFLGYSDIQHPISLQLGGSDPADLATSAKMGEKFGYDEINLNCGCPSDRVQSGSFGACLMREPALVADCIKAMQDAVSIPITVKCRIGIDDSEDYTFLEDFVNIVSATGCADFVIHARKAWLKGLSPKENRDIPPLQYDIVERLKAAFPDLFLPVNGGIKTMEDVKEKLEKFDGVMIGREAYQNPWFLRELEEKIYGGTDLLTAEEIVMQMIPYIKDQQERFGTPVRSVTRHMTGLFQGIPGARAWRQILSTEVHKEGVTAEILETAMNKAFS